MCMLNSEINKDDEFKPSGIFHHIIEEDEISWDTFIKTFVVMF